MIIKIFDFFQKRVVLRRVSLVCLTILMVISLLRLSYKEDISDFLPLSETDKTNMDIYQDISGINKLIVIFNCDNNNPDSTIKAIDYFYDNVKKQDIHHWTNDMTKSFNLEMASAITDFVYQNIPYFLTDNDYTYMDSVLQSTEYISTQLDYDREVLMFPSSAYFSSNISRDPLNLFTPIVSKLHSWQPNNKFEMYDGYIFTPDMTHAIVILSSPFGNSETNKNAELIQLLDDGINKMQQKYSNIEAHVIGGPQIAVGNAHQIKHDSILAISLAVTLIILLLVISFRSVHNILLIAWSIGWGWILALGGLALFRDNVSIIVIGISSVIIGISVNYPLHLIAHVSHEQNIRSALKVICTPLLLGNITTVGAFLALVPLNSTALCDLGLFASLLLLGTILYVLIYLPHQIYVNKKDNNTCIASTRTSKLFNKCNKILESIAEVRLDNTPWLVYAIFALTIVFGWFSLHVRFDSNLSNVNYMTKEQHAEMSYFQKLIASDTTSTKRTVYVVSSANTIDAALDTCLRHGINGISQFLVSQKEQRRRLQHWNEFCKNYYNILHVVLMREAIAKGFSRNAFTDFYTIINRHYIPQQFSYFSIITSSVFANNISIAKDSSHYAFVDKLKVEEISVDSIKARYPGSFDIENLNCSLADGLSENFNYIGWSCSLIVFFFLWFSFRRIELAIIAFVPMAVSWIWILGLMALLGIKFNIVNIILATFIFGQGDDYTIFMTEGCIYEYKTGKPILASYKHSILLSALIMFIGIGTLIVAKHPALHSLAEVVIVGMFSVVLMSWMIPPFLFRIFIKYHKRLRHYCHWKR